MGRKFREFGGSALVGVGFQGIKKTIKSNSFIMSGLYSGIGGLCIIEACRLFGNLNVSERLEQLLAGENPEVAEPVRQYLHDKFPDLEQRTQTPQQVEYHQLQELKKQIMKEKGYLKDD